LAKIPKDFLLFRFFATLFGVGVIAVEICWMILKMWLYVDKLYKFVRMKKKLTLLVDTQLVERMKLLVATNGQSLSAVVEQFFAQQLSKQRGVVKNPEVSDDDVFIAKFGGIATGMGNLTDAEIRDLVYTEQIKKHS
jgi:hypothetical protein